MSKSETNPTGVLFSEDLGLPPALRTLVDKVSNTSEKVEASLEPMDFLFPYEHVFSTGLIALAVFLTWLIIRLGLGWGWMILMMTTLARLYNMNAVRLKRKIERHCRTQLALIDVNQFKLVG